MRVLNIIASIILATISEVGPIALSRTRHAMMAWERLQDLKGVTKCHGKTWGFGISNTRVIVHCMHIIQCGAYESEAKERLIMRKRNDDAHNSH